MNPSPNRMPQFRRWTFGAAISLLTLLAAAPALAEGGQPWIDRVVAKPYPFSFRYGGRAKSDLMPGWPEERRWESLDADRTRTTTTWSDPRTGLQVEWQVTRFADFPAVDWVLWLSNRGSADTPVIENLHALDLSLHNPPNAERRFVLHRTNGGWNDTTNHGMRDVALGPGDDETMSGFNGHSNRRDFPYFRIDSASMTLVAAVGWSGQWRADVFSEKPGSLRVVAGQETTHFKLHPGERVRTPRILLLSWTGDRAECNSQFRRLLLKHYIPPWHGKPPLPALYTNTCFAHGGGGGWLNECNAENQIALIRALRPLGVEAVITDAGWFVGGWPAGAGNWTPDPAKYPQGMAPVAAAAKECGTIYGLWFEPERAVAGTKVYREHPEWLLQMPGSPGQALVDFGLPAVRRHFLEMLDGYLALPGFHVYRQDCNTYTMPFWRANEAADRQGITEMKYIAGLYEYWDAIRAKYPDAFLEECSGAGPRTDLETVMRFRTHQVSECYDQNTPSQASLMGIGQYLPNGVVMTPLFRLDDYSFHSALPSSLCLGWHADDPKFDMARARVLVQRYREVRSLLDQDWYALTPYSLAPSAWLATQFHSPGEQKGMILVFRREAAAEPELHVSLHGLAPQAEYELTWQGAGKTQRVSAAALMDRFPIRLEQPRSSALILYRKAG